MARQSFGGSEVERGLLAVAEASGNTRKAAAVLAEDGLGVDQKTLWTWSRKRHAERYAQIRAEVIPRVQAQAAEQHMEIAERQMGVAQKMTERLAREVDEVPARDLPGGIRNVTTAAAVHTDKALRLREGPPVRIDIDISGTLAELRALGVEVIEGDAEEIEGDSAVVTVGEDENAGP